MLLIAWIVLLVATAVWAQDAYEPDDTPEQATWLFPGLTKTGYSISPAGDVDWVKFTLEEDSNIILETSGGSGDTILYLYKSDGITEITNDDNGGNDLFSRITTFLLRGTYFAKVRAFSPDDNIESYSVMLTREFPKPDAYEPDNTTEQATWLIPGVPQTGHSISPAGDVDWVKFTLEEDSHIILETSAGSGDTILCLYQSDGITGIAINNDGGINQSSEITLSLPAGLYYAKVKSYGGSSFDDLIARYSIMLTLETLQPDIYESDDTPEQATLIIPRVPQTGHNQHTFGDVDWVKFILEEDSHIILETSGQDGNTVLYLYESDGGTEITSDDNGKISIYIQAGLYFAGVQSDRTCYYLSDNYSIMLTSTVEQKIILQRYGFGTMNCTAYSPNPDKPFIVTCGAAGAIIWNAETAQPIRMLRNLDADVSTVDISTDGERVITGSPSGSSVLWNARTGTVIQTFPTGGCFSGAFSPDGTMFVTGNLHGAYLWDIDSGALIRYFREPGIAANNRSYLALDVAFSPDGTKVLTGYYNTAKLWDVETGAAIRTYSSHNWFVSSVAFSPDGTKVLTGSMDNTAKLWDVDTGAEIWTFTGHTYFVHSVAFSPDGTKVLTGSSDKTAKLWNADTGAEIWTFSGHNGSINSVAFSPDGTKILTGGGLTIYSESRDNSVKIWDADTKAEIQTLSGHTEAVHCVAFSPDGTKVLTGSFNTAKLWNVNSSDEIRILSGHTEAVYCVAFSPDGTKILTGSRDNTAKLWNANTGAEICKYSGHTAYIKSVAFSPDGTKILTGSSDNTAKLWDADTSAVIQTYFEHTDDVNSVAFSPDGTKVLTGSSDNSAKLWDIINTSSETRTFTGHTQSVYSVAFSPDGSKVLTGGHDGQTLLWEINPPRAIIVAGGGNYPGNAIAQQTNDLGAYAFQTLKSRGYEAADILYLTAFGPTDPANLSLPFRDADGDGLNDADGWATLENLRQAITGVSVPGAHPDIPLDFGPGAGRLLIIMMNHGHRTRDFMTFRLNETQVLSSITLDGWLDDLQTPPGQEGLVAPPAPDVTLVADCCYSGQFVLDCRLTETERNGGEGWNGSPGHNPAHLEGRKRIIVTSTDPYTEAVFLPPPDMTSFMYNFLGSAYMGNSIGEAWHAGRRFFDAFPISGQTPQLDDGTCSPTSTYAADREFFGASWAYGVQSTMDINRFFPAFADWTGKDAVVVVDPGTTVTLQARMLSGQDPLTVTAVVRTPAPAAVSGEPVTNLPHVSLRRKSADKSSPDFLIWEADIGDIFQDLGEYTVSFTARFPYERLSNPVFGNVLISEGIDPDRTPVRAILALADSADPELAASLKGLTPFAYGVYLARFKDENGFSRPDWVEFLVNPFWHPESNARPGADAVLNAISAMPADTGRLFVHLIGDKADSPGIRLAENDILSAAELNAALDAFQSRPANPTVVLIVDAPGSGAFLTACKADGGRKRVVLTSGRDEDSALFLPGPTLTSFSHKILSAAYQGASLRDAFSSGETFFRRFLRYYLEGRIYPQMDDTGDGRYSIIEDGEFAAGIHLGRRYAYAGADGAGLPFILNVESLRILESPETWRYTARLIEGVDPERVFGLYVEESATEAVIAELPAIEFARDDPEDWTWSAICETPGMGVYSIVVYAAYPDTGEADKLSEPFYTGRSIDRSPPDIYDLAPYNDDSWQTTRNVLAPGSPQNHTIHTEGNQAWIRCITTVDAPHSLVFRNLELPQGTALLVRIYEDGPEEPETDWELIAQDGDRLTWLSGTADPREFYISIEASGVLFPACEYFVEFERNTGINNGIATAIGSDQMQVFWESVPMEFKEFNVLRRRADINDFSRVNSVLIPRAGKTTEYLDQGLDPMTVYFYKVEALDAGGTPGPWTEEFYGVTLADDKKARLLKVLKGNRASLEDLDINGDGKIDIADLIAFLLQNRR